MWLFPLDTEDWMWPDYAGTFGAVRKHNRHPGHDLYCDVGTRVIAVEDGIVVGIQYFTGKMLRSPWWNETFCVLVRGESGVVNYGEINYNRALMVGGRVKRGDFMGRVMRVLKKDKGRPMSMLHFELYDTFDSKHGWPADLMVPDDLLDPADKLKEAALNQFGEIKYYKHESTDDGKEVG
ncbi:MAG: M23 family metallopeptidase [Promethearchaeota archaeon]|jgi:murein DD-endopeptidase MepM/ murein hydrolase activator NlpD